MNPENYLYLSVLLFTIGAAGVIVRRNAIIVFMCIELMLNAVNLAFVTFSRMHGNLDGQLFAFFTMVVAAAEVVCDSLEGGPTDRLAGVSALELRDRLAVPTGRMGRMLLVEDAARALLESIGE